MPSPGGFVEFRFEVIRNAPSRNRQTDDERGAGKRERGRAVDGQEEAEQQDHDRAEERDRGEGQRPAPHQAPP